MLHSLLDAVTSRSQPPEQCGVESSNVVYRRSITGQQIPAISYTTPAQVVLIDDWLDAYELTAALPTIFSKGIGGSLDERAIPVSLGSLAMWDLSTTSEGKRTLHSFFFWPTIRLSCLC